MITACMNPECRKELVYLRDGRVIRVVRRSRERVWLEHFWLCGDCLIRFDFRISEVGEVVLEPRLEPIRPDIPKAPRPAHDLANDLANDLGNDLWMAAHRTEEMSGRRQPALRSEPQKWERPGAA